MTKDEALKLARGHICGAKLCEINSMSSRNEMIRLMDKAIAIIDEALGQPEQEPVAWMHWLHGPVRLFMNKDEAILELDRLNREYPVDRNHRKMRPLVFGDTTTPQLEVSQAMRLYKAIERLCLQAGEETDEAIDWLCGEHGGMFKLYEAYFSPKSPQRKPLSAEEIEQCCYDTDSQVADHPKTWKWTEGFARAIEAAHGIKGDA